MFPERFESGLFSPLRRTKPTKVLVFGRLHSHHRSGHIAMFHAFRAIARSTISPIIWV